MASSKHKPSCKGSMKKMVLQDLLNFSESSDDEQNALDSRSPTVKKGDKKHSLHVEKENMLKKPAVNILNKEKNTMNRGGHAPSERKTAEKYSKVSESSARTFSKQKQTADVHAELRKKCVLAKSKPKTSIELQNMTLADFGISFDFSDNSDNEEKVDKKRSQLKTKKDLVPKITGRAEDKRKRADALHLKLQAPGKLDSNSEKQSEEQFKKGGAVICKAPSSVDTCGSTTKSSVKRKPVPLAEDKQSSNDVETKTSTSSPRTKMYNAVKATILSVKAKTKQLPLLHPDVSVIRSAHCTDSLSAVISPSEESLLPLSESTRLDCPDSVRASKQSFGHLLAHQSSPQLFESSLGDSQNSSYEQLKIVVKKDAEKLLVKESQAWNEQEQKSQGLEDTVPTPSGLETSESESQYVTCLATPDVSSTYEVADVSVQTSFKFGDSASTGITDARQAVADSSLDKQDGEDLPMNKETAGANVNPSKLCNLDQRETTEYREDCSKTAVDLGKPVDLKSTSVSVLTPKEERYDEDDDQPEMSPDVGGENDEQLEKKIEGTVKTCDEVNPTTDGTFYSQEVKSRLPSDSNYFSESPSDTNNTSDSVVHNSQRTLGHKSRVEEGCNLKVGSGITGEEECTPVEQEPCENGSVTSGSSQILDASEASLFSSHKPQRGGNRENIPGSLVRRSPRRHDDSDSEDDDDGKLEAFFQKMRTPAQPSKKAAGTHEDLDEFIVDDSDVTDSEEDISDGDTCATESVCDDVQFELLPRTRSGKQDSTKDDLTHESTTRDEASSSDDSYVPSEEEEDDDDERFQELTTPRSKTIPRFSRSQTPREASPKWYTPATSIKTKPPLRKNLPLDTTTLPSSTRGQAKVGDVWETPASHLSQAGSRLLAKPFSFLSSLSMKTPDHLRDGEARGYITHFKRKQEELSSRLFKLFNFTVFENQLPADMAVVWNKRLLKTAGLCKQKRVNDRYTAVIELSAKVCDTAERVRDTLVHEMCHAAVWILNKAKEGHGPHWKYWARKANRAHPEIPIIRRCHDYSINTKYIYRCVKCGYQIGRHSKSLDTERKVCGRCRGQFQLLSTTNSRAPSTSSSLSATPRTPNPFALFVKENYGSVKRGGGGLPHKQVMEALSREFAKTKINFS